jgi:hypothetical protein
MREGIPCFCPLCCGELCGQVGTSNLECTQCEKVFELKKIQTGLDEFFWDNTPKNNSSRSHVHRTTAEKWK